MQQDFPRILLQQRLSNIPLSCQLPHFFHRTTLSVLLSAGAPLCLNPPSFLHAQLLTSALLFPRSLSWRALKFKTEGPFSLEVGGGADHKHYNLTLPLNTWVLGDFETLLCVPHCTSAPFSCSKLATRLWSFLSMAILARWRAKTPVAKGLSTLAKSKSSEEMSLGGWKRRGE